MKNTRVPTWWNACPQCISNECKVYYRCVHFLQSPKILWLVYFASLSHLEYEFNTKWLHNFLRSYMCIRITWWFYICMCIWLYWQFEQDIMHVEFGQWQHGIHHQCKHLKGAFDMDFTLMFILFLFWTHPQLVFGLGSMITLSAFTKKTLHIFFPFTFHLLIWTFNNNPSCIMTPVTLRELRSPKNEDMGFHNFVLVHWSQPITYMVNTCAMLISFSFHINSTKGWQ